ncbi:hypothetical protein B0T14DRAFT_526137 [Immersiella caudata]|uniref:NTF2 domain-containing protein n=1 Tax=Immersiella caudata TaxID=314043 RepID=A0AA39WDH5_9PEZI|nr:hypothetical protein B0T14DRAFT_526137 [Immersiella caudata]
MAILSRERAVTASAEACEKFVETYYQAINSNKPVASYYVTDNTTYTNAGHPPADICINGQAGLTPKQWDDLLETQRKIPSASNTNPRYHPVRYEVESYDMHVINPDYRFAAPPALLVPDTSKPDLGAGIRLMMMLTVSGTVYFTSDRDGLKQHFNDVFILVPNWDVLAKHGSRAARKLLIASHSYRAF